MNARLIAIAASIVAYAVPSFGQSANFKCPPPNTVVAFSDGTIVTWVEKVGGDACRTHLKLRGGKEVTHLFYVPSASGGPAWVDQVKPSTLWPLTVEKRIVAKYNGPSSSGASIGTWEDTIAVEKVEKIMTKAGSFDTFVVSTTDIGLGNNFKSTSRAWYAPEPGVVVKLEYSDNQGQKFSGEAVTISRR